MPPARRPRPTSARPREATRRRAASRPREAARSRSASGGRPPRQPPAGRGGSDLLARIIVAVPAAVVAIVFVDLGGTAWALFMAAIGLACLNELYELLDRWRPLTLVGFASLVAMVLAGRYGSLKVVLEVAMATVPVLVLFVLVRPQHGGSTIAVAGTLLGVYWIGFAFAHAVLLRQLPHGNGIIVDVLLGTFVGDTAAYLGGRLFGRRRLAPEVSPHKTVEGLGCGMVTAIVTVVVAGTYQDWLTQTDALLLGFAVAVLGPVGDLFESMVKRDAGTKDAGKLFGAHGGALDRLDAVIFTVVAGYYIWLAVLS